MNIKERQEAVNEIRVLASVGGPFNIRFLEAFVDADVLYICLLYTSPSPRD
mgnify:CR=1 FL=1